jgi:hypothetical protein
MASHARPGIAPRRLISPFGLSPAGQVHEGLVCAHRLGARHALRRLTLFGESVARR